MATRRLSPIDVLVMLSVVALGVAVVVPGLGQAQDDKRLKLCASNLRALGQGLYIYAQGDDHFPMSAPPRAENDGAMALFAKETRTALPASGAMPSPTVDLWMLVRADNNTSKQFICPLTKDTPDPAEDPSQYFDFLGAEHLSYAYQYQYDPDRPVLGTPNNPTFPIMADSNPYIKGGVKTAPLDDRNSPAAGNSTNHGTKRPSQNVMYVDSHVQLERSPDVGLEGAADSKLRKSHRRDNCYTVHEAGKPLDPGVAPTSTKCNVGSKSDACLVP